MTLTIPNDQLPAFLKKRDIHQEVTNIIVEQLEKGTVPWDKPWRDGENNIPFRLPKNSITGKHYRGINIVLLWAGSLKHNLASNEWASFKQWKEKKQSIRKGEKGSMIVFYDTVEKEVDGEIQNVPIIKHSYVFNRNQLENSNAPLFEDQQETLSIVERIDTVENFISNTRVQIDQNGSRACYNRQNDSITMPDQTLFIDTEKCSATEGYYSTLLHEMTHWTGHASRLDRNLGKKFGDKHYAVEELVAELCAAFLTTEFEISRPEKENHASYIASWLEVLKENKYAVLSAASEASKASDYLHKLQPA